MSTFLSSIIADFTARNPLRFNQLKMTLDYKDLQPPTDNTHIQKINDLVHVNHQYRLAKNLHIPKKHYWSSLKVMLTIFFFISRVVQFEFLPQGQIVNWHSTEGVLKRNEKFTKSDQSCREAIHSSFTMTRAGPLLYVHSRVLYKI